MDLLTAQDIQNLLHVDKSTVYRMAGDGRLPAIKVGRQWRFPAPAIGRMFDFDVSAEPVDADPKDADPKDAEGAAAHPIDPDIAGDVITVLARALGVMMVVTDVGGMPITRIVNPAPRLAGHLEDSEIFADCLAEWRSMAADLDLAPRFENRGIGFECARALIRSGAALVGMVLVGGVASEGEEVSDLYSLDPDRRRLVVELLPKIGALLSKVAVVPDRRQ